MPVSTLDTLRQLLRGFSSPPPPEGLDPPVVDLSVVHAVPRMDFRNPKNLEAGKREAEATPKQQRDLYDVEKFEKVSATQMSVNPLE